MDAGVQPAKELPAGICFLMLRQFDMQPTDALESDTSSCNNSTEYYNDDESILPPPMPFSNFRARATGSAPRLMQDFLSRARSLSPTRGARPLGPGANGRAVFQSITMTKSMPDLHSSRSTHNRSIGHSVLSSVAECGCRLGTHALRSRNEEFETLLDGL
jgi:hypothetical protein